MLSVHCCHAERTMREGALSLSAMGESSHQCTCEGSHHISHLSNRKQSNKLFNRMCSILLS